MKNKLKYYYWFSLAVIALVTFFLWHISYDSQETAECIGSGSFVTFYDADFCNIRRIKLDSTATRVFSNPDGTKYLLQSENPDQSISIYDVNGSQLKEVLLAGEEWFQPMNS